MGWTLLTLHRGDEQHGQNGERPCNDKDIASVGRERTYGLDPTCTFFFIALLLIVYYTKNGQNQRLYKHIQNTMQNQEATC
jgi:hypothetical protein